MTCLQPVCVEAFFPAGWLCDMQPPLTERYSLYCVWFHRGDGSNKGTRPPRRHHASDKGPQPRRQCQFATVLLTALVACRRWTSLAALLHHERREEKRREDFFNQRNIICVLFPSSFRDFPSNCSLFLHKPWERSTDENRRPTEENKLSRLYSQEWKYSRQKLTYSYLHSRRNKSRKGFFSTRKETPSPLFLLCLNTTDQLCKCSHHFHLNGHEEKKWCYYFLIGYCSLVARSGSSSSSSSRPGISSEC